MAGIVAFGSSIPAYRLPRDVIAREWGHPSLGGEKAVANHDEDSLTLAVNAALDCFVDPIEARVDAVFFASTTSPYREKQAAATVAAVLDAGPQVRTADFGDSLRAGTSAMLAGFDAIAGGASRVLVCAGDCRMGEPDSVTEQNYGDAGGAVVLGAEGVLADLVASHTLSEEFHGSWRTAEQDHLHSFPGAFETKYGYARFVSAAARGALSKAKVEAADLAAAVIAGPNPRAVQSVAKALGIDPKKALIDTFWSTLGDTGAAQPLVMLAAALERVRPGDLLLMVGYGDGGDGLLFRATDRAGCVRPRRSVYRQIEAKRLLPSYGRFARFRKLIRKESQNPDLSTPVALFRDQKAILPLYGGKCPACGTVQFPRQRVCIECGHRGGLEDHKLARRGSVFTFTNDFIADSPDPPVTSAVVELDGGGRLYVQLTDCDAEQAAIDLPVELTFRNYHDGSGLHNYFWKATPTGVSG
jgi:3-hydroxy-3-methylglutaryl CoA synthase